MVKSTFVLPELESIAPSQCAQTPEVELLLATRPFETSEGDWIHHWQSYSNRPDLSLARTAEGYILQSPGSADFLIDEVKREVRVWVEPETAPETQRHLLLDHILPRFLAHLGGLVLHASAVELRGRCVAFLGESGQGKSTLAGSFHANGHPVLCDDGLVIRPVGGGFGAQATYTGLRLWPESVEGLFTEAPELSPMAHYSTKRRIIISRPGEPALLPLAALFEIETSTNPGVSLVPLSARETCLAIVRNSFQLDVTDPRHAARLFADASDVAERVPAFRLSYPQDFPTLPAVRKAIEDCLDRLEAAEIMSPQPPA